jgi:uncharacterized membrane protein YraQ (UPF0718 family)
MNSCEATDLEPPLLTSERQGDYDGRMRDRTTLILLVAVLILAGVAWQQGGAQLALSGLIRGGDTLLSVTPLLVAAFLVAGLAQTLLTREVVTRWLGARSGWRGIVLASLGGALMPGGPYVYYPIAAVLFQAGAGLGVLVAFVTAKNLWSVTRLPLEFALLGPQLTLIRFAATLVFPPVLGLLAEALFGRYADRIRDGVVA